MTNQHGPQTQTLSPEALKEALDKSSSINRTLGLGFSVFIFIMALMVAATTDMDLFIPDSTFTFPLVNLPLNIKYFYIAAPFVVLIMHYNLLYNLHQHSEKLLSLYPSKTNSENRTNETTTEKEHDSLLMYPFLFNFAHSKQNPLHGRALNLVIRTTIFILPLALLFYILIRFADYQSMTISAWHFAAVLLDMALIATHSRSIIQVIKAGNDEVSDTYIWQDYFNFREDESGIKISGINVRKLLIGIVPTFFMMNYAFIIFLLGNLFRLITGSKNTNWLNSKKAISYQIFFVKFLELEFMITLFTVAYFSFFVYIMSGNLNRETAQDSLISYIIPRLNLPEEVLVKSQPDQQIKTLYLNTSLTPEERNQKEQEIMLKFTEPYILKGRSFRYANLRETVLTRSDLRKADLTGAVLENSKLQKARLDSAIFQRANLQRVNLQEADIIDTKLQGANLNEAKLQGANIRKAKLQGSDLIKIELQGANLINAELQGAVLSSAKLQWADLWDAKLSGADLNGAELQSAKLQNTDLQGAILTTAKIQATELNGTKLPGACLTNAILQGSSLSNVNLQGAYLGGANLEGTYNGYINLQGANLRNANLQGANLADANLQGIIFNATKLRGAFFNESCADSVLMIYELVETFNIFSNDSVIEGIAMYIECEEEKILFKTRMSKAKVRFENDTLTLAEKIPNAKIYRPEDLASDSSFFFIRRRIATQNKDVAQSMLFSVKLSRSQREINKSLYTDLYRFLKSNHPDYLEGFRWDERGQLIPTAQ